jgi:hypothetical protein
MEPTIPSKIEELPEDLKGWTPEELAWLASVPEALQPVARRNGKLLFCLAMQNGVTQVAVNRLASQLRGNRAGMTALRQVAATLDDLCKTTLRLSGRSIADMRGCQRECEVAHSLATGGKQLKEGDRVSPGGILLDS